MEIQSRETTWHVIALFLITVLLQIVLALVVFRVELARLSAATGYIVNADLIAMGSGLVVSVGILLMWFAGFRPGDLGFTRARLKSGIVATVLIWVAMQVVLVTAAITSGNVELSSGIRQWGWGPMLGHMFAMVLAVAVYEEVAFRSFLLPQLYAKFKRLYRFRLATAIVVSAMVFSLVHIPTRVWIGGYAGVELLSNLTILTFVGIFGAIAYLWSGNIVLLIGVHGLWNAPLALVESPIPAWMVLAAISVPVIVFWRRIVGVQTRKMRIVIEPLESGQSKPATIAL